MKLFIFTQSVSYHNNVYKHLVCAENEKTARERYVKSTGEILGSLIVKELKEDVYLMSIDDFYERKVL